MTTCLGCVLIYYDFIFVVRDYVSSSFAMDDLFGTDAELGVWQTPAEHEAIIDVSTTRNRLTSTLQLFWKSLLPTFIFEHTLCRKLMIHVQPIHSIIGSALAVHFEAYLQSNSCVQKRSIFSSSRNRFCELDDYF